jgi:hypothetical protein
MTSREINRRRLKYSLAGFAAGGVVAILARWLFIGRVAPYEAIMAGMIGAAVLLRYAQNRKSLPTEDEVAVIKMREEMSPLDLKGLRQVPTTLNTEQERKMRRDF